MHPTPRVTVMTTMRSCFALLSIFTYSLAFALDKPMSPGMLLPDFVSRTSYIPSVWRSAVYRRFAFLGVSAIGSFHVIGVELCCWVIFVRVTIENDLFGDERLGDEH